MLVIFRCVGTGSKGNAFILETKDEALLIEAGMKFKDITKAMDFNISKLKGLAVTHCHSDHFKYHEEIENTGIDTFYPWQTDKRMVQMGGFTVQAFQVIHDVDCFGFYIKHKDFGKLLFVTDTEYVPQLFKKLEVNHIVVECNNQAEYVSEDLQKKDRVLQTHLSYETMKNFVLANLTPHLENVILIHYSDTNCDIEKACKDLRQELYGTNVNVDYARSGGYSTVLRR